MPRQCGAYLGLIFFFAAQCASANCSLIDTPGTTVAERVASVSAGQVTAGTPINLRVVLDDPEVLCPGDACVVKGGAAGIELKRSGDWVCVGLAGKGALGTISGWLPVARWQSLSGAPQPDAHWVGVWQNEGGKIAITTASANQLAIEGHAIWVGATGQDHYGVFELTRAQSGGVVSTMEADSCQVAVRLVGDYLVAADNSNCGGMNVRFDGMYRLRHR